MSLYFTSNDRDVWNPASGTGRLYSDQVASLARELGVESGLAPVISDEVKIDETVFVAFVQAGLAFSLQLGADSLPRALVSPVLAVSVALVETLGSAALPPLPDSLVGPVAAARLHIGTP
jgi:hypothetical protein